MRQKLSLLLAASLLFPEAAFSDMRIKVRTVENGRVSFETIYVKGSLRRTDYESTERIAIIDDCASRRSYRVNLDWGFYSQEKWAWPTHGPSSTKQGEAQPSGLSPDLRDTGEKAVFVGRPARHFIRILQPPAISPVRPGRQIKERSDDVWFLEFYVPYGCAPAELPPALEPRAAPGTQPLYPARQLKESRGLFLAADGTTREFSDKYETEVIELSTEPLDVHLFEIPKGFRKVHHIPISRIQGAD